MACRRLGHRTCYHCGAPYYPTTASRRYCSISCSNLSRGGAVSQERILARVRVEGDCWLWTGTRNGAGYGIIKHFDKRVRAHRASYEAFVGPIPEGLFVLHSCDTPPCVNPAHLSPGTKGDNARDMASKGRQALQQKKRARLAQESDSAPQTVKQAQAHANPAA